MRLIILMNEEAYNIDIVGFHGTSVEYAEKIIDTTELKPGNLRNDHWLGQGAYFFREDPEQAKLWAMNRYARTPAILKTIIKTNNKDFLNLDTRSGLNYFNSFIKNEVKPRIQSGEVEIELQTDKKENIKNIFRCFFCNELPNEIKAIQRTFFVDKAGLNREKHFREMNIFVHGIQICIRDTGLIDFQETSIKYINNSHTFERKKKAKQKKQNRFN